MKKREYKIQKNRNLYGCGFSDIWDKDSTSYSKGSGKPQDIFELFASEGCHDVHHLYVIFTVDDTAWGLVGFFNERFFTKM